MADIWIGLDLGSLVDYTAAAVLRRSLTFDAETGWPERDALGAARYKFDVLAIRRFALGTPYLAIVQHITGQLQRVEMGRSPRLTIDASGVGNAVVEMFRTALKSLPHIEVHAITITAGRGWSLVAQRTYHVSKLELVGSIRAALESGRLRVPPQLEHAELLKRELQDFRVKITPAANEVFSAREGAHDDIVLAVSLPLFLGGLRSMQLIPDPDWLLPREQQAVSAEIRALEQEEVEAAEAERCGRLREKEARQARRHASIDDPMWWSEPGAPPSPWEDAP
jgi:hypothetical protein